MGEQGSSLSDTSLSDSPPNCEEFIVEQLKKCRTCGVEKPLLGFNKDKTKKYGVGGECKICAKATAKKYYYANSESIKKRVSCYSETYTPKFTRDIDARLKNLCTNAKQRKNKEFNITEKDLFDLWDKQDGKCAYSKLPMSAASNQLYTVSLDRIDSSIGYVVGNIQLVCAAVNKMKQEYTQDVFLTLCNLITQNNKAPDYPTELAHIS
jgi:hypothetical protein